MYSQTTDAIHMYTFAYLETMQLQVYYLWPWHGVSCIQYRVCIALIVLLIVSVRQILIS